MMFVCFEAFERYAGLTLNISEGHCALRKYFRILRHLLQSHNLILILSQFDHTIKIYLPIWLTILTITHGHFANYSAKQLPRLPTKLGSTSFLNVCGLLCHGANFCRVGIVAIPFYEYFVHHSHIITKDNNFPARFEAQHWPDTVTFGKW